MCCSDFSSSVGRLYPPLDLQGQDEAARKARGIQGTRMPETLQSRHSEAADALDVLGEGEQLLLQGPQFNGNSLARAQWLLAKAVSWRSINRFERKKNVGLAIRPA